MSSYSMNYNWHKKFNTSSKINHNELYLLGLAERNKRKKELEAKNTSAEEVRKRELEKNFITYQKDYSVKSKSNSRTTVSRNSRPESRIEKAAVSKSRKSWAESLGNNDLPAFAVGDGATPLPQYSDDFDSSESSISDVELCVEPASPRLSNTFVIPRLIESGHKSGRKTWAIDSSIPFSKGKETTPKREILSPGRLSVSSDSPIESEIESAPPGDQLRQMALDRRKKNWLEESWNLIDTIEKNNKGRQSNLVLPTTLNIEEMPEEDEGDPEMKIEIPNLPRGKIVTMYILSTWGDSNYVGLNGVEFWSRDGKQISPSQVSSDGSLQESIDPRSNFYNLIDGMNNTKDDIHCWLSEVNSTMTPKIIFHFNDYETLAMIRIWNFNRNRVHANRGVRTIVLEIDNKPCFGGEIAMASGSIDSGLPWGDNILFTKDDIILEKISRNDSSYPDA